MIVPGEGPLNVFLADQGVAGSTACRCSTRSAPASGSPSCARPSTRERPPPARVGFYGAQPPRALVDAARAFYGVPEALG